MSLILFFINLALFQRSNVQAGYAFNLSPGFTLYDIESSSALLHSVHTDTRTCRLVLMQENKRGLAPFSLSPLLNCERETRFLEHSPAYNLTSSLEVEPCTWFGFSPFNALKPLGFYQNHMYI